RRLPLVPGSDPPRPDRRQLRPSLRPRRVSAPHRTHSLISLLRRSARMRATILHRPRDIRCEEVAEPKILYPTDAIIKLSATCICGSDLWPYRGLQDVNEPMHMGHEYCGIVVEV